MKPNWLAIGTVTWGMVVASVHAEPASTAFSFQGQLKDAGQPANGDYDMVFRLFSQESGGAATAGPVVFDGEPGNPAAVSLVNGLFHVDLDFGAAFDGTALWLELEVRTHGAGDYSSLTPRQALTATPIALYALNAPGADDSWIDHGSDLSNANQGNVGIGTDEPTS